MTDKPKIQVALVEDDTALSEATQQSLEIEGFAVSSFRNATTALRGISEDFPGVVVSDVRMPGMDGIEFFQQLRQLDADIPVILVTGHGDVRMAVEAMKCGAADFLTKPFATASLARSIRLAAERRELVLENRRLRSALNRTSDGSFLGSSQTAQKLRSLVDAVAPSEIDVIIEGASGSGKTTLARFIHERSQRQSRPFITIDDGIMCHEDAELLLFGREPSAGLSRTGMLERANGGTLFIDNLLFRTDQVQTRLFKALELRAVLPKGAERARKLNVRVILARNLTDDEDNQASTALIEQRLGSVKITVPDLASRRSDLPEIFRYFVALHEKETGTEAPEIGPLQWSFIQKHAWPANLRELNGYARAFVLGLANIDQPEIGSDAAHSLTQIVADFERALLEDALRRSQGKVSELETLLQTPRKTLYDKLNKHALKPQDFKQS